MYVFEHYVCFHSNVFGYVKDKAIPFKVRPQGVIDIAGRCSCHRRRSRLNASSCQGALKQRPGVTLDRDTQSTVP
jgi:hypothetical protein